MNGFNINDAIYYLELHTYMSSHHICAKHIRQSLEAGGLDTTGHPLYARDYIKWLPLNGWAEIGTLKTEHACSEFSKNGLHPGDIAIYGKPGEPNHPGHICMWSGHRWLSDFKQHNMNVYKDFPGIIHIFRYGGELIKHPFEYGVV